MNFYTFSLDPKPNNEHAQNRATRPIREGNQQRDLRLDTSAEVSTASPTKSESVKSTTEFGKRYRQTFS